jgi:uncharacterized membrane protein YfcA
VDNILSIIAIFFSGFIASIISAIVGFGGAILLLPLLTYFMGIKFAVPLLTTAQIFGNASRAYFGRKELEWKPIFNFLIGAVPFVVIGSILFSFLNGNIVKIIVGILLVIIVIGRRIKPEFKITNKGMFFGGAFTGIISGIAGSAGPLSAFLFNSLKTNAAAYIASEAFSALIMHIIKIILYKKYLKIELKIIVYGILIGCTMILGSFLGKRFVEKIPKKYFQIIIEICLVLSGMQMIIIN